LNDAESSRLHHGIEPTSEGALVRLSLRTPSYTAVGMIVVLIAASFGALAASSEARIREMQHHVMPFDVSKSVHIFRMTETGGVEQVVVRDTADSDQIALIRQHLKHEAAKFQRGDYSDPATLHGPGMPGLKELHAHASQIRVSYSELPEGAQITFETDDLALLTAVHRWFGAQLSEHGADARAE